MKRRLWLFVCGVLATAFEAWPQASDLSPRKASSDTDTTTSDRLATPTSEPQSDSAEKPVFRIDQPGTITFTVGVTVRGKVEKPQVVIFLPKEKVFYRDLTLSRSFRAELLAPLPVETRSIP